MIRVSCPRTCATLAHIHGEVELEVDGPVTQRTRAGRAGGAVPGAGRHGCATTTRTGDAAFVRFYACQEDLSHESPDDPLPDAVADGPSRS